MRKEELNVHVVVNDTTICFDDCGEGDVPILFIHGFPFDKSCWDPQMSFLRHHHRVISYDIRGFGKSTSGLAAPSIALYADDLIVFMDQLGIKVVIACGISMGGYILMNAVSRFPERFKALILCDTQCIADTPETKAKREESIIQVESGKLSEYADQFINKVFQQDNGKSNSFLVTRTKAIITSTSPESVAAGLRALMERDDMCTWISLIPVPSLIICGEEDILTPPRQSELLYYQIEQSELYLIPQAGHLSNLEQPQLFNNRINQFIAKVLSKSGVLALWE
ncbi:MAG: alpha/beta fold hydrolase [Saprospiraceae bacterium]